MPSFRQGIGLRTRIEALRHLLKQVVSGEQPPEKVLQGIEALANGTPEKDRRNLYVTSLALPNKALQQPATLAPDDRHEVDGSKRACRI